MKYCSIILLACLLFSCSKTIYVARHAEKSNPSAGMSSDVPLSEAGQQRAIALKETLKNKKIEAVYSTNYIRTRSTAQPTADHFGLPVATYNAKPDTAFINLLKRSNKNTLVVGHSNTIDDIANMLCGETKVKGDLPETEYDNLYIIKKKGKKFTFTATKYGAASK